jgi:WD40 repeat protein
MTKMVHRPAPSHDAGDSRGEAKASTTEARLVEKLCLRNHKDQVWDVCFSNDGTRLASSGADKTTVIYQLDSFEVVHVLSGHSGGIANASWSPDDSKIVTCSQDNTARVWDTTACSPFPTFLGSRI